MLLQKIFDFLFGSSNFIKSPRKQDKFLRTSDMEVILRDLKLGIALGDITLTPNINNIPKKEIEKLQYLSKMGVYVGGSYTLKLYGLLERDCDDIDLFGDIESLINDGTIKKNNIVNKSSDYNGNHLRYKIKTEMGVLDIFQKSNEIDIREVENIKFSSPLIALHEKSKYGRYKDSNDFQFIVKKFNLS